MVGKKNRDKLKRYQKFLEQKGYKDCEGDIYDTEIHQYVVSFIVAATRVNVERIKRIAQEQEFYYLIDDEERKMPVQVISYRDIFDNLTGEIVQSSEGKMRTMFGI